MKERKKIALVAHDNRKKDLIEWVEWNWEILIQHKLLCTGTTGNLIENVLSQRLRDNGKTKTFHIEKLKSGPLGGDQQLGALICDGDVDILIFFWDAMEPQPHDVDVKALLRIATLYNIVYACSRSSADFVISSPLLDTKYSPAFPDFDNYINRKL
ncbi:methylglyoxal synthase [Bacteroidales bacterium OttesenSCG-928-M06]|nr:methylglyoxal synthase [Bacteroidales bacterium OttesenSCG-928-M06]